MASVPVFMFCTPEHVFGGAEGVGSRFHILRSRTRFRRFRGRRVPFSCFALPDSFSAVLRTSGHFFCFPLPDTFSAVWRTSGPVFMFCAPGFVFGGSEGVGSRFHVLRPRTHFRQYRGRRVPFSYFALPDSFSAISRVSGLVFMFCATGFIFGVSEGVGSCFHILGPRTCFRQYRGRRVPFSFFALKDTFSIMWRTSGPVFMFCTPDLVFGGSEGVGSRFHVLHFRTRFRRFRGRWVPFSCFASPYSF
jgi:hypothetical protein